MFSEVRVWWCGVPARGTGRMRRRLSGGGRVAGREGTGMNQHRTRPMRQWLVQAPAPRFGRSAGVTCRPQALLVRPGTGEEPHERSCSWGSLLHASAHRGARLDGRGRRQQRLPPCALSRTPSAARFLVLSPCEGETTEHRISPDQGHWPEPPLLQADPSGPAHASDAVPHCDASRARPTDRTPAT